MERLFINLENEVLRGNVLDVGSENYGIVYELCKKTNKTDIDVSYISGKEEKNCINKNSYDSCVAFFMLKDLIMDRDKKKFFRDMHDFLKDDAILYLWDIDKSMFKTFRRSIRIVLPGMKIRDIEINNFNILSNNSCKKICNMMSPYFKIIDVKCSDDLYYIKAQKKEGNFNEKSTSYSNKFSVYTQQFSGEIFKSLRKGIGLRN
ncbi:hypothetical protein [Clostridium felsineum]|uniref:Uncharacterized protein n=1 Tax=Clostridium felsineum TaxID=36839 RepID=A0A1S8LBA3_9CLOT|nr:hypothetical protein [Clostridium felsineum]MCR3760112.1 hypothetical protein [Clostridium felsineum]URZ05818.1 hypothetical protein CLROS_011490 [Clostridium felsineum]URZ10857.1 hypothetical protein CROST_015720 [Clostridium felsineum]URZ15598.1 hypothetical protein CLFE_016430 [Clostridium felsineum DSM 794]